MLGKYRRTHFFVACSFNVLQCFFPEFSKIRSWIQQTRQGFLRAYPIALSTNTALLTVLYGMDSSESVHSAQGFFIFVWEGIPRPMFYMVCISTV